MSDLTGYLDQNQIVRVGVSCFIFIGDRFIAIQRDGSHGAGDWGVPGGWMDFGETPEQTAIREAKEEVGVDIHHVDVLGFTNDVFKHNGKHALTVWTKSVWKSGTVSNMEPDKIKAVALVGMDSMKTPLFLPYKNMMETHIYSDVLIFSRRDYARGEW